MLALYPLTLSVLFLSHPQGPVQGAKVHSKHSLNGPHSVPSFVLHSHKSLKPSPQEHCFQSHQRVSPSILPGSERASQRTRREPWPLPTSQHSVFYVMFKVVPAPLPPGPAVLGRAPDLQKILEKSDQQTCAMHLGRCEAGPVLQISAP